MTSSKPADTRNMRRLGETEGRAVRAAIAKQRPMTSNVVPADDDLVERVARAMWEDAELRSMRSPWVMPTRFADNAERYRSSARAAIASLSSELARYRNALEEAREALDRIDSEGKSDYMATVACALATIDAALNPIGERE